MRQARERDAAVFGRATFRPHGLDARWDGLRWFGGHGHTDDVVRSLTLAHGNDPLDASEPQLRVETSIVSPVERDGDRMTLEEARFSLVQSQVETLFHEAGDVPDPVRRAAFPYNTVVGDPTEPWADCDLRIDGSAVRFHVLESRGAWVAHAVHDEVLIGIEAKNWAIDSVGIVTVSDLAPYEQGSEVLRRHRR